MPHDNHPVLDLDKRFSVDAFTRAVTYQSDAKLILGQYDHNSERYTFDVPRYIEQHDMASCTKARVHFINVGDKGRNSDVYEADDLEISSEDDNLVTFSWLISQNATRIEGSLNFVLELKCLDENDPDIIEYSWHSAICTGIKIAAGMDNGDSVVEQYSDVLEKWLKDLKEAGLTSLEEIELARLKALADVEAINPESTVQAITEAKTNALNAIDEAVETLDPETAKQAIETAKTEALTEIQEKIDTFTQDVTTHNDDVNAHPLLQRQAEIHYYTIDVDGNDDSRSGGWLDLSGHWAYMCSPSGIAYHNGTGYIDEQTDVIFVDLRAIDTDAQPELEEAFSKIHRIDFYGNRASYNVYVFASEKPAVSIPLKIAVLKGAKMSS